LCVSAHWFAEGSFVTGNAWPETIHDFSGFPEELYRVRYPAPGSPELAGRVRELLGAERVAASEEWGLDHGAWSVLRHLRPAADLPVVQLSVDYRLPPAEHLALGRALAPLRAEGVLVLGSGNLVHNLRHALTHYDDPETPAWATQFDAEAARALEQHDSAYLIRAVETATGRQAHPTLDHYLPLLYPLGAADETAEVRFPLVGFDLNSLSMRAVQWG
jgi:4,5-DOPA dioxygenase extradiol